MEIKHLLISTPRYPPSDQEQSVLVQSGFLCPCIVSIGDYCSFSHCLSAAPAFEKAVIKYRKIDVPLLSHVWSVPCGHLGEPASHHCPPPELFTCHNSNTTAACHSSSPEPPETTPLPSASVKSTHRGPPSGITLWLSFCAGLSHLAQFPQDSSNFSPGNNVLSLRLT